MIDKLQVEVSALEQEELIRALKEHPLFASDHEAYGVIKEEIEELEEATKAARKAFKTLWQYVREDEPATVNMSSGIVEASLIQAACEAIQAAAMCAKLRESQDGGVINE